MSCRQPDERPPWKAWLPKDGMPEPAHIYEGVKLIATVFDHQAALEIERLHNEQMGQGINP